MAKKSSYWQDREEQERRWQMKQLADDERYISQIRSQYEAAIRRINDDINNQLQWLSTRSGQPYAEMQKEVDNLDIQRASQDAQKLVGRANQLRGQGHRVTYGDFTSEENARMRLYNATMRINRLEFLKSEVGLELTQLTGELNTSLGLKLTDDARKEFKRQAGIMGEQLGNAKPWTSFQPQVLVMKNVQGGNWSQRLWKNQDVLKANLDAVLSAGFISGESNQKMAQRLRKAVRSTMENQRYATERLVRTESARVAYEVQRESIEANGFKWVEWFAEPSACTVCARLARVDNGEGPGIYPLKKVPKIPQDTHPNCRCSIGSYYSDKMLDKKLNELGFGKKQSRSAKSEIDEATFNSLMKKDIKNLSEEDIRAIGSKVYDSLVKDSIANSKKISGLESGFANINAGYKNGTFSYDEYLEVWHANADSIKFIRNSQADHVAKIIGKYRPVGSTKLSFQPRSSVPLRKMIKNAYDHYPTEWSKRAEERNTLLVKNEKRGYYDDYRNIIAANKDDYGAQSTMYHELGHRHENTNPEIVRLENEFYERRTKGEKEELLSKLTGNKEYDKNMEKAKPDQFKDPYMGKVYKNFIGQKTGFELLSMGLEGIYQGRYNLYEDKDMATFILGLLLKG